MRSTSSHVAEAVQAAVEAKSGPWGNSSMEQRAALLHRCADVMEQELEAFALAESRDTGKPLNLARNMDVARAISNFRFFAGYLLHGAQDLRHQGGGDMFGSPVNRSGVPTLTALNYCRCCTKFRQPSFGGVVINAIFCHHATVSKHYKNTNITEHRLGSKRTGTTTVFTPLVVPFF